jgi:hypothetical protein
MELIDPAASTLLASLPYAQGHGASQGVHAGIIYYAIACAAKARVCVCLGSGGGFVPCLMRQAQRDMALDPSVTYLVDAILPEAGFGSSEVEGGWRDADGVFSKYYSDIVALNCLTTEAARGFFRKNRVRIDFLHVDADHSFDGALSDFELYAPMVRESGFITFHDTSTQGVRNVLKTVREKNPEFQCLDLPDLGAGIALLRRKVS